jgi:hypothetical protein
MRPATSGPQQGEFMTDAPAPRGLANLPFFLESGLFAPACG